MSSAFIIPLYEQDASSRQPLKLNYPLRMSTLTLASTLTFQPKPKGRHFWDRMLHPYQREIEKEKRRLWREGEETKSGQIPTSLSPTQEFKPGFGGDGGGGIAVGSGSDDGGDGGGGGDDGLGRRVDSSPVLSPTPSSSPPTTTTMLSSTHHAQVRYGASCFAIVHPKVDAPNKRIKRNDLL